MLMSKAYITRKECFNAAHRLFRPEFSDEKNLEIFGKCSNPNWHGHNYTLWVTLRGEIDPQTGFVADLKKVSQIIKDVIIEKVDHKNINLEVDFMKGKMASTENMAKSIFEELEPAINLPGVELYSVKLAETENNIVEVCKDE